MPSKIVTYICLDCSKEVPTRNRLGTSVCKSCNAKRNCKSIADRGITGNKLRPFEYAYNSLVRGAKSVNRSVNITYEDYLSFTKVNNCTYCNAVIPWTAFTNPTKRNCNYFLDRKDNSVGYELLNLAVCCPTCNKMKGSCFTYEEFLVIAPIIRRMRK